MVVCSFTVQVLAQLGLLKNLLVGLTSTSRQDSSMSKWRHCPALKVLAQEHVSYSQGARPRSRGLTIAGRLHSSSQTETSSLLALTFPFRRSIFPTKFHGRRNQRIPRHFSPVHYEVWRLHPQRDVRHFAPSACTTMLLRIRERITEELMVLFHPR